MKRIDHVLPVLQPVARHDLRAAAADRAVVGLDEFAGPEFLEAVVARQQRLLLRRAQIGEYQAVALLDRIPGLAHLVAARPAALARRAARGSGLPRRTASRDSSSGCRAPRPCRSRAWCRGARSADRRGPARPCAVAKQDQVFAEHAHRRGRVAGVRREADRMPVAAQQFAHRRAGADLGELGVVGRRACR